MEIGNIQLNKVYSRRNRKHLKTCNHLNTVVKNLPLINHEMKMFYVRIVQNFLEEKILILYRGYKRDTSPPYINT